MGLIIHILGMIQLNWKDSSLNQIELVSVRSNPNLLYHHCLFDLPSGSSGKGFCSNICSCCPTFYFNLSGSQDGSPMRMYKIVTLCFIALCPLLLLGWRVTRSSDLLLHFGLLEIQITAIQCCIDLYGVCQAIAVCFLITPIQTKCLPECMEAATALAYKDKLNSRVKIYQSFFFFLDSTAHCSPTEK